MGELARHLGVSVPYVSDVERGVRAPFTTHRIVDTAMFLGVSPNALFEAAAATRGELVLSVENASKSKRELGSYLTRGWGDLTDEEAESLRAILEKKYAP